MASCITPIFLYSLPRSGSTLLQRILGSHTEIHTVSEPWILLPLLSTYIELDVKASYGHDGVVAAIKDFCDELPHGKEDYLEEIRSFVLGLYGKASPDSARYFLDKTPRYSQAAHHIVNLFPDGKHIVLWRNPLAIISSIVHSWEDNGWALSFYDVDLYSGIEGLIEASRIEGKQLFCIRFEDIITDPESQMRRLFEFLDLPYAPEVTECFHTLTLNGRMGDSLGSREYQALSNEPLYKWKQELSNPLRKHIAKRYLIWIGEERLRQMGYSLSELLAEVDSIPTNARFLIRDIVSNITRITQYFFVHIIPIKRIILRSA